MQTAIREFGGASFAVVRRYSDFDWLHEQLVRAHPGIMIPPVPEKAIVGTLRVLVHFHALVLAYVLSLCRLQVDLVMNL